jgi:hypothetical protein
MRPAVGIAPPVEKGRDRAAQEAAMEMAPVETAPVETAPAVALAGIQAILKTDVIFGKAKVSKEQEGQDRRILIADPVLATSAVVKTAMAIAPSLPHAPILEEVATVLRVAAIPVAPAAKTSPNGTVNPAPAPTMEMLRGATETHAPDLTVM